MVWDTRVDEFTVYPKYRPPYKSAWKKGTIGFINTSEVLPRVGRPHWGFPHLGHEERSICSVGSLYFPLLRTFHLFWYCFLNGINDGSLNLPLLIDSRSRQYLSRALCWLLYLISHTLWSGWRIFQRGKEMYLLTILHRIILKLAILDH